MNASANHLIPKYVCGRGWGNTTPCTVNWCKKVRGAFLASSYCMGFQNFVVSNKIHPLKKIVEYSTVHAVYRQRQLLYICIYIIFFHTSKAKFFIPIVPHLYKAPPAKSASFTPFPWSRYHRSQLLMMTVARSKRRLLTNKVFTSIKM